MDFEYRYTAEQQAFRQEVRSWLDDNIPTGVRWPNDAKNMPHETWQWVKTFREQLGAKGWLHATYPKEYGGGGLSAEHDVVIQEELEKQDILIKSIKNTYDRLDKESKRRMLLLTPDSSKRLFGF